MNIYQNMASRETLEQHSDRGLWVAVLLQALKDWKHGNMRLRRAAEVFFFQGGPDFDRVCRGAGLLPERVLRKLRAVKDDTPAQAGFVGCVTAPRENPY